MPWRRRCCIARTRADPLAADSGNVSAAVAIPCVTRRSSGLCRKAPLTRCTPESSRTTECPQRRSVSSCCHLSPRKYDPGGTGAAPGDVKFRGRPSGKMLSLTLNVMTHIRPALYCGQQAGKPLTSVHGRQHRGSSGRPPGRTRYC